MAWHDDLFAGERRAAVAVEKLSFDRSNPRFTPDKQPVNQTDVAIIQYLDRTADLGELVQSIAASGYIDIEPLIVIGRGENLVVLEGNRRLAALKVLTSDELAREAKVSVPDMTPAHRNTLREVSAYRVAHEDEARNLIGFKHINGPQGWDAYAKARYAARWLDDEIDKGDQGLPLTEIAARMGDNNETLYRMVSAVYVLRQAEQHDLFRVEDRFRGNFHFSHLYTALTYSEYREFLGLGRADRSSNPPSEPVAERFYSHLRQLLRWLYGSKLANVQPAIKTQAPDLSNLKRVLGHPVARLMMIESGDLQEALTQTVDGGDRFVSAIVAAHAALRTASTELTNAPIDDQTFQLSVQVRELARHVGRNLELRRTDSDEE